MSVELMESGQSTEMGERSKTPPSPMKSAFFVFAVAAVSAAISIVFVSLFKPDGSLSGIYIDKFVHEIMGIGLVVFLALRLALAVNAYASVKTAIGSFHAACSTIALTSANVQEALTISAGAEHEKNGLAHFRSELARLLCFSARCLSHAVKGEEVVKDSAIMTSPEMLVIKSPVHPTPTLFVTKLVGKLIAKEREAGRLDSALVAQFNAQLGEMVKAYNTAMAAKKMPMPAAVREFATAWLYAFALTVPVVLAFLCQPSTWVAPCGSLFIVAFLFALNEIATQLEDLSSVFTFDVDLVGIEYQLQVDLGKFATDSFANGEGML